MLKRTGMARVGLMLITSWSLTARAANEASYPLPSPEPEAYDGSMNAILSSFAITAVIPLALMAVDPIPPAQPKPSAPKAETKSEAKSEKKAEPKHESNGGGSGEKPKDEFKKAGESAPDYANAGRAAGAGGKSLGQKTADGDLAGGAKDFGKGMGETGKDIGVGTAKVGTSVGKGIGRVFSKKKKPETSDK
jgi:hypothetical protein